jgi:hypothetical protein
MMAQNSMGYDNVRNGNALLAFHCTVRGGVSRLPHIYNPLVRPRRSRPNSLHYRRLQNYGGDAVRWLIGRNGPFAR